MDTSLIWLISGLILLIAEMTTGSIVLIFIAFGCFTSAAISIIAPESLTLQIVVCAVVSLLGGLLLRKPIKRRFLKSTNLQADVGREILIDADIEPHKRNRITYQGTTWDATNIGTENIKNGDHVSIVGIDGNILLIRRCD